MDKLTLARIELLHPRLRGEAAKIYAEICQALTGRAMCRFTYTLRTFQEQQALYDLGRTCKNVSGATAKKPMGSIVTNARPGQSFHNYGLAVDIALILDGREASWDTVKDFDGDRVADWMECVKVFKKYGWQWGGDWTTLKDYPHFQKTFGFTWQQLQKLYVSQGIDNTSLYPKF